MILLEFGFTYLFVNLSVYLEWYRKVAAGEYLGKRNLSARQNFQKIVIHL